jgi:hypothetical protein
VQEVPVDGFFRLQLVQVLEVIGDSFPFGWVWHSSVMRIIIIHVQLRFLADRLGELGDFLVEAFEAVLIEVALQFLVNFLPRNTVDQPANHLYQRNVALVLGLAELYLGDQPFELLLDSGILEEAGNEGKQLQTVFGECGGEVAFDALVLISGFEDEIL